MNSRVQTLKERPDLTAALKELNRKTWPDFIVHGDSCDWARLYTELKDFILVITDPADRLVGGGFTVPIRWSGNLDDLPPSIETIVEEGIENKGRNAGTLTAIAVVVDRRFRGESISAEILKQIQSQAAVRGFQSLVIPVRPMWKARYPLQGKALCIEEGI